MTVTSVREIRSTRNKRSEVTVDGALRFVLYDAELRKYGISEGEELDDAVIDEIMNDLLPLRAKKRAMNLLKERDYTEAKLREKLIEGGYPEEVTVVALEYVKSYGYVDDERYAESYVRYRMESEPRRKLEIKLIEKGVDRDIVSSVIERCYEETGDDEEDPETAQIRKLMSKKNFDPKTADYEDKQKFMAMAVRRGYSYDAITRVFSS
ncbi:MAG: recombination regulator RecX [Lachnospiraceae bacterium]|nr:recombination regulator RecX [Lachnospiraceae bacterium]